MRAYLKRLVNYSKDLILKLLFSFEETPFSDGSVNIDSADFKLYENAYLYNSETWFTLFGNNKTYYNLDFDSMIERRDQNVKLVHNNNKSPLITEFHQINKL